MDNLNLFWPHLWKQTADGPRLSAYRCGKCGHTLFPKNDLCTNCLNEDDMQEITLETRGILYSYTVTYAPIENWPLPHAMGWITIPENRVRLIAPLSMNGENEDYFIGEDMEMVIEKYWDTDEGPVMGFKFRPVRRGEDGGHK